MPPRIDSSSSLQSCDLCKRKKVSCNGERPCTNCYNSNECKYSIERHRPTLLASSVPQSRRLSSGSACETCRRRKTKCDGQQPCNYCSTNGIECLNNSERRKRGLPPVIPIKNQSGHKRGNQETAATSNGFEATRSIQMIDHHVIVKNDPARRRPIGRSVIGGRASSLSDSTSEASSLSRNNTAKNYTTTAVDLSNKQYALRISQSPPSLSPINLSSPTSSPPFATSPLPSQSRSTDLQQNTFASQPSRYHIPPIYNQAPPSIRAIGQQIAHINTHAQDDIGIPTPPASSDPIDMESVYKRKIPSVMDQLSDRTFNSLETYSASFPIYPLHSAMELHKP
ncbi:hypothetical protein K450DRAFT_297196 [Umbelopsis ramanniana AG]|uniref:Zn(2)-C6 fungal-type domain-containing protein n=1 Tax=Umbelopsis ramanniana AG TaxID=1314678 RepID=A0AAD5EGI1_UMBRA|nr:uncharacterized protein K450DRAFT_297196 [Umbelopsis ramanniana AG]KAI8583416.1 hypothetical protein K450DRAFT_297196 [Umbelopsis ramanniana AG]